MILLCPSELAGKVVYLRSTSSLFNVPERREEEKLCVYINGLEHPWHFDCLSQLKNFYRLFVIDLPNLGTILP